jgi:uncharacterized protein YdhG (YjbR/CyaY superfamily)
MPDTKKPAKRSPGKGGTSDAWTDEERDAMKERAREMKAARGRKDADDGERDVMAKIAEMPLADRSMAERLHAIVKENAPSLVPRTWYGMPAYARDGKVVCFFTPAAKFKERYATFGFNAEARLDDGSMWPTSWALTKLTPGDEKRIAELVRKAVG